MATKRVWADVEKNRLYLILSGLFEDEELGRISSETVSEAGKLKAGFSVVNDISDFKPASPVGAKHIRRTQVALREMGVKRVVRVVGSVIAAMQFERTGREAGYGAETAKTVQEAETILDREGR